MSKEMDEKIAKWLGCNVVAGRCDCPKNTPEDLQNGSFGLSISKHGSPQISPYSTNMQYTMQVLDKLGQLNPIHIEVYDKQYVVRIGSTDSAMGESLSETICQVTCQVYNI